MKIRPVGAELFHAEAVTDTKLIVAFHNFADALPLCLKKDSSVIYISQNTFKHVHRNFSAS
jgi:hypothetical protein